MSFVDGMLSSPSASTGARRRSEVHREIAPIPVPFYVRSATATPPSHKKSPSKLTSSATPNGAVPNLPLTGSPKEGRSPSAGLSNPYSPRVLNRRPQHQMTPRGSKTSHSVAFPGFGSSASRFVPKTEIFDPDTTKQFTPRSEFDPKSYLSHRPPGFGRSADRFKEEEIFKSTTPGPGIYEPDEWEDEIVMMSSPRGRSSGQTPRGSPPSRQGAAPSPRVTQKQSPRSQSPPRQPVDNSSPRSIPRDSAGTSSPSVVATASPAVQHVLEAEGVAVVRRPASPGRRATVASGGMDRSQSPVRRGSDASRSSMPRRDSFNRHFLNSPVVEEISKKEEEDKKVVQAREEQAQREAQRKQQLVASLQQGTILKKYTHDGKNASHNRFFRLDPATGVLEWKNSASSSDRPRTIVVTSASKDLSGMVRVLPESKQQVSFSVHGEGAHPHIFIRCPSTQIRDQWVEGIHTFLEMKNASPV